MKFENEENLKFHKCWGYSWQLRIKLCEKSGRRSLNCFASRIWRVCLSTSDPMIWRCNWSTCIETIRGSSPSANTKATITSSCLNRIEFISTARVIAFLTTSHTRLCSMANTSSWWSWKNEIGWTWSYSLMNFSPLLCSYVLVGRKCFRIAVFFLRKSTFLRTLEISISSTFRSYLLSH